MSVDSPNPASGLPRTVSPDVRCGPSYRLSPWERPAAGRVRVPFTAQRKHPHPSPLPGGEGAGVTPRLALSSWGGFGLPVSREPALLTSEAMDGAAPVSPSERSPGWQSCSVRRLPPRRTGVPPVPSCSTARPKTRATPPGCLRMRSRERSGRIFRMPFHISCRTEFPLGNVLVVIEELAGRARQDRRDACPTVGRTGGTPVPRHAGPPGEQAPCRKGLPSGAFFHLIDRRKRRGFPGRENLRQAPALAEPLNSSGGFTSVLFPALSTPGAHEYEWATRDSNPQPPRCKRGALTN